MTTDLSQALVFIGIITLACTVLSPILVWILTPKTDRVGNANPTL